MKVSCISTGWKNDIYLVIDEMQKLNEKEANQLLFMKCQIKQFTNGSYDTTTFLFLLPSSSSTLLSSHKVWSVTNAKLLMDGWVTGERFNVRFKTISGTIYKFFNNWYFTIFTQLPSLQKNVLHCSFILFFISLINFFGHYITFKS